MIRRILTIVILIFTALMLLPLIQGINDSASLGPLARAYLTGAPQELNSPNVVTAVVVTYRGLDTLGEVTVLFAAAAGIMLVFSNGSRAKKSSSNVKRQAPSELLHTGASFLFPLLLLFGIYIFVHGHLSPGGGFQGGVVIASAILFLLLAGVIDKVNHLFLTILEALAGLSYVAVALAGIWLAAGFLDPRFLPSGTWGSVFSAGAIPVIYSLIGLKVGSELSSVLQAMKPRRDQEDLHA